MKRLCFILAALICAPAAFALPPSVTPPQTTPTAASIGAIPATSIGKPGGVAGLNALGGVSIDAANRPPNASDDLRYYSSGDGYDGINTNVISQGALWGYTDPGTGFQLYQLAQPEYNDANWLPVTAGLPCDSISVVVCTVGVSLYPLTASFTGSPGTLYKLNAAGAVVSQVIAAPGVPGNDSSFASSDQFCAGTALFWATECKIIPNEQIHGYAVTTDWAITSATITTGVGTGSISGTVFTDTTHTSGIFVVGEVITVQTGTVTANTTIVSLGTGTGANNGGTYNLSTSNTVTSTTVTGSGIGVGGTNGSKTLTLNMAGCASVQTAIALGATVSGGAVQPGLTLENASFSQNPGECIGAGGIATQLGTGGGFTVQPVFTVTWFPSYAPAFPASPNVNNLRGLVWNTWVGSHDLPPQGLGNQNRLLRIATASYNSASSWYAMLGTSDDSTAGATSLANGNFTMIENSDALNGINEGGVNQSGFQSVSAGGVRCQANNKAVLKQAGVPTVTIINLNSVGANCWEGDDYVNAPGVWPAETTTGFTFGSPNSLAPVNNSSVSFRGDAVDMIMGATPASTGLTGSYADLNNLRISLTKRAQISPQSVNVVAIDGGGTANNGGNGGTLDWQRIGVTSLRSSGGQPLSARAYNYSTSGATVASSMTAFYNISGAANFYHDFGCESAVVCIMELTGLRVELEHYCANVAADCQSTINSASITGTTLTTSSGAAVLPGTVISGGTILAGTVVTTFPAGCYGTGVCTYGVNQSQNTSCTSCLAETTQAKVAAFIAGEYKNWIYQLHQLGNGYYGVVATVNNPQLTTGAFVKGDRVTLQPPPGSGITCSITGEGATHNPYIDYPVYSISRVASNNPVAGNILLQDHGVCSGGTLPAFGTAPITMAGWVPSGGSGNWQTATFTVTLIPVTVPKAVMGRMFLQYATLNTSFQLQVLEDASLGGSGLYADMLANATNPAPVPCTTIVTCETLGTGYGADALHDQFGANFMGPNSFFWSPTADAACSNDNEHLTAFCQAASAGSYRNVLNPLMPYP